MRKYLAFLAMALLGSVSQLRAESADMSSLQLPTIPSTLVQPADRAGYLVEHFWDNLDFASDARAHDQSFLEQNFVDFLSVLPIAAQQSQQRGIETLLNEARKDSESFGGIMRLAEKYLYELQSPMASDEVYEIFLQNILSDTSFPETNKIRYRAQLEAVQKNRPGMPAPDFAYETIGGQSTSLYQTASENDILLIFYDPDCDHCREVMNTIIANDIFRNQTDTGSLSVLAIYSGDDKELWAERAAELPSDWTVGYEDGTIQDEGRFIIREMPTIFVLDKDKRVLRKELHPDNIIEELIQLK